MDRRYQEYGVPHAYRGYGIALYRMGDKGPFAGSVSKGLGYHKTEIEGQNGPAQCYSWCRGYIDCLVDLVEPLQKVRKKTHYDTYTHTEL